MPVSHEQSSKNQDELKRRAAQRAAEFIESGMVLGLGTGSTIRFALEIISEKIRDGELKDVVGVPSSLQTEASSKKLGIPLTTFQEHAALDVTIDGADEVDPQLSLIKGGGGALLREKILAQSSHRNIIIVDESKCSAQLGTLWALPVEVLPFGWLPEGRFIESLGAHVTLRKDPDNTPFLTDQENYILDCNFGKIPRPEELARQLDMRAGVMAHGLFVGLATDVIIAGEGEIRHLKGGV
jgi:ribose 5-phosphate isomerase A